MDIITVVMNSATESSSQVILMNTFENQLMLGILVCFPVYYSIIYFSLYDLICENRLIQIWRKQESKP